jgi:hypothetical protein
MSYIKGERLYVELNPSQVRRRLKGHGFGVRRVESAGTHRSVIIHTATGEHLRALEALFRGVMPPPGASMPPAASGEESFPSDADREHRLPPSATDD